MTNQEALKSLPKNCSWIAVKGTPDNKKVAEMIASDHNVKCAHGETESYIEANDYDLVQTYCWTDEKLEAACEELSNRLPFRVVPDNFEY